MQTAWRPLAPVKRALLVSTVISAGISILMLAAPLFALQLLEAAVPTGSWDILIQAGAIAAVLLVVAAVLDMCREVILVRAGLWVDHYLGQEMIETSVALALPRTQVRRRRDALKALREALCTGRMTVAVDLPWGLLGCAAILALNPLLGMASLAAWCTVGAVALMLAMSAERARKRAQSHQEHVDTWCDEVSSAVEAGIGPRLARGGMTAFEQVNRPYVANAYARGIRSAILRAVSRAFVAIGTCALFATGCLLAIEGAISAGAAVAAAIVAYRSLATVEQAARNWHDIAAVRHAWTVIGTEHESDVIRRRSLEAGRTRINGSIVLEASSMTYRGARSPALSETSITIEPTMALGIIGPAGAGKSTLAAIVAGQIEPTSGRAEIDGISLYRIQRSTTGPVIGYLPNSPSLVAGTVIENVTNFAAGASAASVEIVARFAGVHDIIAALPNGYLTDVGAGGSNVHQKARRAIALTRALHGGPKLVVLDEPETGLDEAGIVRMESLLAQLRGSGIGIVMVTREPRLLRQMHAVVSIEQGRLSNMVQAHRLPAAADDARNNLARQVA